MRITYKCSIFTYCSLYSGLPIN